MSLRSLVKMQLVYTGKKKTNTSIIFLTVVGNNSKKDHSGLLILVYSAEPEPEDLPAWKVDTTGL